MLQYSVEPVSYLKILTVKTFHVEKRHILGEDSLRIALELEGLSYQSVLPADKLKMLSAINERCVALTENLKVHAASFNEASNYWMIRNMLEELVEIASQEISRMTVTTPES